MTDSNIKKGVNAQYGRYATGGLKFNFGGMASPESEDAVCRAVIHLGSADKFRTYPLTCPNEIAEKLIQKEKDRMEQKVREELIAMGWTPPKQWSPRKGPAVSSIGVHKLVENGLTSPTADLRDTADNHLRRVSRLIAYVQEHAPEHDMIGPGHTVWLTEDDDWITQEVTMAGKQHLGAVTMPEGVAKLLCQQLNNGTVVL